MNGKKLKCGCKSGYIFCDEAKDLYIEAEGLWRIWCQTRDPKDKKKYEKAKKRYSKHRRGLNGQAA